jgi:hypothetical protein
MTELQTSYLIDAVRAISNGPSAATGDQVREYVFANFGCEIATADVVTLLQELANEGLLDAIDAAPGDDGLPVLGYRLPPRS